MTDFIDPNEFESEDELFSYILEHLVKPRLREALGAEAMTIADDECPGDVAGLLSTEEAEEAKAAVEGLRGRDRDRLDAAKDAFDREDAGE